VLAGLANAADRRHLMTEQSRRIILVVAPLLSYSLSDGIGGNGFVAAFVCGIAFHYIRRSHHIEREMGLIHDTATLVTASWLGPRGTTSIVFGSVALHGLTAPAIARAYERRDARAQEAAGSAAS
jgi:NhaP-type Na+/H+ or K+/H+ antiporter